MATPFFPAVEPAETASVAGAYVPPFAPAGGAVSAIPSATTIWHNPNPTTPSFLDDAEWAHSYLIIHQLSNSSYRYMYLFWISAALLTLGATLLHWTGSRGGVFSASFNKFGLRRRTWRKKHSLEKAKKEGKPFRQPDSFAPNAQILILTLLFIAVVLMSFVGPDHVSPYTGVFDLANNLTRREAMVPSTTSIRPPEYTIAKSWWTSGARIGLTAFALFPLCILFALKAAPFAVFSLSFLTQIHFDKLARFHIWTGRLIWFVTTIHVALWSVQLGIDHRGPGSDKNVWNYAWLHKPFICACIAYICLTGVVVLSLQSFRSRFYEQFYVLHVILVALTLLFAGFHFPSIGWWCWGSLMLWAAERFYRLIRWAYVNGYIFAPPVSRNLRVMHDHNYAAGKDDMSEFGVQREASGGGGGLERGDSFHTRRSAKRETWRSTDSYGSTTTLIGGVGPVLKRESFHHISNKTPPPGWAHATLLTGKTVRIRLLTARPVKWSPGQHVLLRVPCVSKYTTHPFTIASVCDNEHLTGHVIELIIRARSGFTLKLWDTIVRLSSGGDYLREKGDTRPRRGAFIKADVDGPFGSSIRARWGVNSTFIIITGGSGISFGASLLEYVCLCISGRDGKELGGLPGGWGHGDFKTTRVRFVWLVREYSHIQWCAAIVRRCMEMVPSYTLQVDIYVSNSKSKRTSFMPPKPERHQPEMDDVASPLLHTRFGDPRRMRSGDNDSVESLDSLLPPDARLTDAEVGYGWTDRKLGEFDLGHEEHVLDMTNFGGEEDTKTAAEARLCMRVKEEGKLRRAITRGKATAAAVKPDMKRKSGDGRTLQAPPKGAHDPSARHSKRMSYTKTPFTSADSYRPSMRSASPSVDDGQYNPYTTNSPTGGLEKPSGDGGGDQMRSEGPADDVLLDLDEEEMEDMNVVSEMAHPGKPKLDEIIFEEVEKSKGAVGVACCGPISLNAVVRKIVAAQISPSRILAGDMRGAINLATEEFEW